MVGIFVITTGGASKGSCHGDLGEYDNLHHHHHHHHHHHDIIIIIWSSFPG